MDKEDRHQNGVPSAIVSYFEPRRIPMEECQAHCFPDINRVGNASESCGQKDIRGVLNVQLLLNGMDQEVCPE